MDSTAIREIHHGNHSLRNIVNAYVMKQSCCHKDVLGKHIRMNHTEAIIPKCKLSRQCLLSFFCPTVPDMLTKFLYFFSVVYDTIRHLLFSYFYNPSFSLILFLSSPLCKLCSPQCWLLVILLFSFYFLPLWNDHVFEMLGLCFSYHFLLSNSGSQFLHHFLYHIFALPTHFVLIQILHPFLQISSHLPRVSLILPMIHSNPV